jgi:hypothetical protein
LVLPFGLLVWSVWFFGLVCLFFLVLGVFLFGRGSAPNLGRDCAQTPKNQRITIVFGLGRGAFQIWFCHLVFRSPPKNQMTKPKVKTKMVAATTATATATAPATAAATETTAATEATAAAAKAAAAAATSTQRQQQQQQ